MKFRIKKRYAVAAVMNAAALIAAAVLTISGSKLAAGAGSNYAAERWKNGTDYKCSQVSCYFTDDSGFNTDTVNNIRGKILEELKAASVEPENGKKLCPDAYSTPIGKFYTEGDLVRSCEADITAVGGDFFLFRDFRLLDGHYISPDDLMKDSAVIDKTLACNLYGSAEVAGMNMYIGDRKYLIAGVVDVPDTKYEKQCAGKVPRAYIAFSEAERLTGRVNDELGITDHLPVTCYECVVPDPVEDLAYNSVKKFAKEQYENTSEVVLNTGRFDPKKRAKAMKKLYKSVIREEPIVYPFWENASRIVEFKLTQIYFARRIQ